MIFGMHGMDEIERIEFY